jgi:hypothetical protein
VLRMQCYNYTIRPSCSVAQYAASPVTPHCSCRGLAGGCCDGVCTCACKTDGIGHVLNPSCPLMPISCIIAAKEQRPVPQPHQGGQGRSGNRCWVVGMSRWLVAEAQHGSATHSLSD